MTRVSVLRAAMGVIVASATAGCGGQALAWGATGHRLIGEAGMAAYGNPIVATRYMAPDDQKQNWTVDYLRSNIVKRLNFTADRLGDKPYVAADRFTAADLYVASFLHWGMMFGVVEKRPAFEAYVKPHLERPAARRAEEKAAKLSEK